jgi:20S proteasome alpha/beta subunit
VTTVAYRDGVLAADRRVTQGDRIMQYRYQKVYKNQHGWLYGACGKVADMERFFEWADPFDGAPGGEPPPKGEFEGLMVSPKGAVFEVEDGTWWRAKTKLHAVGSGASAALGALHAGADALTAVKIAQLIDSASGGGVDFVTIKD